MFCSCWRFIDYYGIPRVNPWVNPLSKSFKKRKLVTKIFFSDNVGWSFKNVWKMISADVKANQNNKK